MLNWICRMISSKLGNFLADQGISNDTKWYQMTVPLKVAPYIFRCLLESFFKAQGMFKSLALSRMFDWKASNKCDIESIKYISIYSIDVLYISILCIFVSNQHRWEIVSHDSPFQLLWRRACQFHAPPARDFFPQHPKFGVNKIHKWMMRLSMV